MTIKKLLAIALMLATLIFAASFWAIGDDEDPDGDKARPVLTDQLPSGR